MSWPSLFNNIRERSWDDILSSIAVQPPFDIDILDESNSFEHLISQEHKSSVEKLNEILSIPGRHYCYIRDTLFLCTKAFHALAASRDAVVAGRYSWATVDAHHASLLAAKAIASLAGVIAASATPGYIVVDSFPELGRKDYIIKFKKDNRGIDSPVRILRNGASLLEQNHIWILFTRILRQLRFDDERNNLRKYIMSLNIGKHKPSRNRIIYDLNFWIFVDDMLNPSSPPQIHTLYNNHYDHIGVKDFYICDIVFELLQSMLNDLCGILLIDFPYYTSDHLNRLSLERSFFGSNSFLYGETQ